MNEKKKVAALNSIIFHWMTYSSIKQRLAAPQRREKVFLIIFMGFPVQRWR